MEFILVDSSFHDEKGDAAGTELDRNPALAVAQRFLTPDIEHLGLAALVNILPVHGDRRVVLRVAVENGQGL